MQIRKDSFEERIKLSQITPEFDSPYEINEYSYIRMKTRKKTNP